MRKLPPYPIFFPDATRGMVRGLDNQDTEKTGTPGVLVNTYHLWRMIPEEQMKTMGGVKKLMNYQGAVISDSGGFQVMSIVKKGGGKVRDEGVWFKPENSPRILLTPEISIRYQMAMQTDLMVVLDDFTTPTANMWEARETVGRTIEWAKRSKDEYERIVKEEKISEADRPHLIGVVQGGYDQKLRKECAERLIEIGFDGLGYGGWPLTPDGEFDYESARTIADAAPEGYLLYGLGIGKPEDIVGCSRLGYNVYDCVLPTRDARHGRLYKWTEGVNNLEGKEFYEYYVPAKAKHKNDMSSVDKNCSCQLCSNYSRAYLHHLFKVGDSLAGRLATIHNMTFYGELMERLKS